MSKHFTRLYREIWDDPEFVSMSDAGQNVFLYLLSTPIGSQFGIFKAGIASLAESKRSEIKSFRKGFQEVLRKGFVRHCEDNLLVWIPSYVKRNPPGNTKVIMGWGKAWNQLPDCQIKTESYHGILESIQEFKPDWVKVFDSSFKRPIERAIERAIESPFEHNVQSSEFRVQSSVPPISPKGDKWREKDFYEFHEAYHKAGKSLTPAKKAWKKAIEENRLPEQPVLMGALRNHMNSIRWNEGHVLGEAPFLNQSRWEQVLPEVNGKSNGTEQLPNAEDVKPDWMRK